MAVETFHTLIARNKRNTWLLIFIFAAFFVGLGLLIGYVWGGGEMAVSFTTAGIAAAVAFFASDEARYITGQVLFVDGGTSARMYLGVSEKKKDSLAGAKTLEKQ